MRSTFVVLVCGMVCSHTAVSQSHLKVILGPNLIILEPPLLLLLINNWHLWHKYVLALLGVLLATPTAL